MPKEYRSYTVEAALRGCLAHDGRPYTSTTTVTRAKVPQRGDRVRGFKGGDWFVTRVLSTGPVLLTLPDRSRAVTRRTD